MRADGHHWTNRSTYVVYRQVLADCPAHEVAETIAEWEQECQGRDFVPAFAEQLAEDLHEQYVEAWAPECGCLLIAAACEILLSRVDWLQVASRLVEHVAGTPEPIVVQAAGAAEPSRAVNRAAAPAPCLVCEPAESRPPERMDADTLFAAAQTLERLALRRAPATLARLHERVLRRRARLLGDLAQHMELSPDEPPLTRRTVWRKGRRPRVVHWLVGGIAATGQHVAFEERDWVACGAVRHGIAAHEGRHWGRATMDEAPLTCPQCLALFQELQN